VRKPEQGTAPKLFYVDGDVTAMDPLVAQSAATGHAFGEVVDPRAEGEFEVSLGEQGLSFGGPIHVESGRIAEQMVQVAWNAQHEVPWHWQVPAYLVTKAIAAGLFFILGWLAVSQPASMQPSDVVWAGGLGVLMTLATTALLVLDLERPERFLRILLRPQWRSWLARGAFILVGFSIVTGLWWVGEAAAFTRFAEATEALRSSGARRIFGAVLLPLSTMTAIYTAFLLAQAEGRDLWQNALLPIRFFVQALVLGGGAMVFLIALRLALGFPSTGLQLGLSVYIGGLLLHLPMLLIGEFGMTHASEVAARAANDMRHGRYRKHVLWGGVVLGHVLPLLLAPFAVVVIGYGSSSWLGSSLVVGLGPVCCITGFYLYEYAFIMAPQHVPNS
jgi:formate-dependent nitrite reductase membrane component NrfD